MKRRELFGMVAALGLGSGAPAPWPRLPGATGFRLAAEGVPEAAAVLAAEIPTPTRVVRVNDRGELDAALSSARPGDHIVMAPGSYGESRIHLDVQGTESRPVVIRASSLLQTRWPGGFDFSERSAHVLLWGLDLKDAESKLRGTRNVIRRCRIWPPFKPHRASTGIAARRSSNCRIDYCEIRLYTTNEVLRLFGRRWAKSVYSGVWGNYWKGSFRKGDISKNLVIERCLFTGGPHNVPYSRPNAQFVEAQGPYRESSRPQNWLNWTIRLCYGDVTRDRTIFDFKCARMIADRVHIDSPPGARIQLRDGTTHDVLRCRLANGSIATHRNDHRIWNSLAANIFVMAGNAAWDHLGPPRFWPASKNVHIAGCRALLRVGHVYNSSFVYPAEDTRIEAHSGDVLLGLQVRTSIRPEGSVPFEEPIRLSRAEVGPEAPWVGVEG